MATVLHLMKDAGSPSASATIARQIGAGDRVTLVLLEGAPAPADAEGVTIQRVPEGLSYSQLLDLIFGADQVIAW